MSLDLVPPLSIRTLVESLDVYGALAIRWGEEPRDGEGIARAVGEILGSPGFGRPYFPDDFTLPSRDELDSGAVPVNFRHHPWDVLGVIMAADVDDHALWLALRLGVAGSALLAQGYDAVSIELDSWVPPRRLCGLALTRDGGQRYPSARAFTADAVSTLMQRKDQEFREACNRWFPILAQMSLADGGRQPHPSRSQTGSTREGWAESRAFLLSPGADPPSVHGGTAGSGSRGLAVPATVNREG